MRRVQRRDILGLRDLLRHKPLRALTSLDQIGTSLKKGLNPFTTGNPFLGTKLLGFSIGRGLGALKGLTPLEPQDISLYLFKVTCPQMWVSSCKGVKRAFTRLILKKVLGRSLNPSRSPR